MNHLQKKKTYNEGLKLRLGTVHHLIAYVIDFANYASVSSNIIIVSALYLNKAVKSHK